MKKKISEEQIISDVKQYVLWKTVKVITNHFNSDYGMFYETFQRWARIQSCRGKAFAKTWHDIRTINEFMSIDRKTIEILTRKNPGIMKTLEEQGFLKILNDGKLCWGKKDGKCAKYQTFCKRYIPDVKIIQQIFADGADKFLDFGNGQYSKRLVKLIHSRHPAKAAEVQETEPENAAESVKSEEIIQEKNQKMNTNEIFEDIKLETREQMKERQAEDESEMNFRKMMAADDAWEKTNARRRAAWKAELAARIRARTVLEVEPAEEDLMELVAGM